MLFFSGRAAAQGSRRIFMQKSLSFRTYAKINLSLDVTGVRENGYHDVEMVMQGIHL